MTLTRQSPDRPLGQSRPTPAATPRAPLYTPEQRTRRDATRWTLIQGLLAPFQFLVFAISLGLVLRALLSGEGETLAAWSVLFKTLVLYTIMVTGAIWEKVVFGRYLFAEAFWWEDLFSMLVLALHTTWVVMWLFGLGDTTAQLCVALAAYVTYLINAAQFIRKLRLARLGDAARATPRSSPEGASAGDVPAVRTAAGAA